MTLARIPKDFYPTESKLTHVLQTSVNISGSVFEPCAGNSDISDMFAGCITNDIDKTKLTHWNLDATEIRSWDRFGKYDWVISNPPFSQALPIIKNSWENCHIGMAMLLRLTWMEPCKDRALWLHNNADQMTRLIPVNPRPRFRKDTKGSDNATVAWFVWEKAWSWNSLHIQCPFQFRHGWR